MRPMSKWCTFAWLTLMVGCSAPRVDNTRLGSADLVAMTDAMVRSMLADAALAGRSSESPAIQ